MLYFSDALSRQCLSYFVSLSLIFFFHTTATTVFYPSRHTLSLHAARPISPPLRHVVGARRNPTRPKTHGPTSARHQPRTAPAQCDRLSPAGRADRKSTRLNSRH